MSSNPPSEQKTVYIEYRFASGLVLSGFVEESGVASMLRNNAAPSQEPAEATPLFGTRHAVLLQDQCIVEFSVGNPSFEALVFHRRTST